MVTLTDKHVWKSVTKCPKPTTYELVRVALKDGKEKAAWWTGQEWDGRRLKPEDEVVAFKYFHETSERIKRNT